jgi:hypothetical protein
MLAFSKNYNFTTLEEFVEKHPTGLASGKWNMRSLSGNPIHHAGIHRKISNGPSNKPSQ